ncbi:MAG: hypothetical protein U0790_26090 [Isosphaeraceae bacterium]
MGKSHGAREQKKRAKQRAKRLERRSSIARRGSDDPTVRLQHADRLPVVEALVSDSIWESGIGHLLIARKEAEGQLLIGVYLVDVYCLGVKNAFWRAGSHADLRDTIERLKRIGPARPIEPECLVKLILGAVEFAHAYGFPPHPDFRHASRLLAGIDPAGCPRQFEYGRDGKPFYMRGPNESLAVARIIAERVTEAGGHYMVALDGPDDLPVHGRQDEALDLADEDE